MRDVSCVAWVCIVLGTVTGCGDGGGNGAFVATASASITGAQFASWQYDNDVNSVYCSNYDGSLNIHYGATPGSLSDSLDLMMDGYTGPGSYNFTFDAFDPVYKSVKVQVGASYIYHYHYDFSRIDAHEVYSNCSLIVSGDAQRISGSFSCTDMPAQNISADYEANPVEFQPSVDVSGTFACDLSTL